MKLGHLDFLTTGESDWKYAWTEVVRTRVAHEQISTTTFINTAKKYCPKFLSGLPRGQMVKKVDAYLAEVQKRRNDRVQINFDRQSMLTLRSTLCQIQICLGRYWEECEQLEAYQEFQSHALVEVMYLGKRVLRYAWNEHLPDHRKYRLEDRPNYVPIRTLRWSWHSATVEYVTMRMVPDPKNPFAPNHLEPVILSANITRKGNAYWLVSERLEGTVRSLGSNQKRTGT